MGSSFVLHRAEPGVIPGTLYGLLSIIRMVPESRGVGCEHSLKQIQTNKNKRKSAWMLLKGKNSEF